MFNNSYSSNYGLFNTPKINSIYGQNTDLFRSSNSISSVGTSSLFSSNNLYTSCPTCSGGSGYNSTYSNLSYRLY